MGAALTYARRYALFTMVGIAGEDDLDAPPDATNEAGEAHKAVAAEFALNPGPAPVPVGAGQLETGKGITAAVREKLSAEESAAIRAQLVQEIETLPEDDLQPRAIAILKSKNRLSVVDAKLVEDAFAARMAQQEPSVEAMTADQPPSVPVSPILPQPLPASSDIVKRPRGRPRKVKPVVEPSGPPAVPSNAVTADDQPHVIPLQADTAPRKIDSSVLMNSEPRRIRDKAHLKFVGSQPCLICARSPADAHHLKFTQPRAMGRKVSDEFTVPLCRTHHRDIHSFGDEIAWWERRAIDPVATARMLWISTRRIE
jgi:hypothetical protein